MNEQPNTEAGESPIAQSTELRPPKQGQFLKSEDEHTDFDASEVKDESDGMGEHDFLGKTNLENREED